MIGFTEKADIFIKNDKTIDELEKGVEVIVKNIVLKE